MRIVGGHLRGRALRGPDSHEIRPTTDRLRETLFNILEHNHGGVAGRRVIDLFAGTGALALEAMSRGAACALMVDNGTQARALIRDNVEALGLGGVTRVFRRDARKLGTAPSGERFDIAFLDPPYARGLAEPTLLALRDGHWLEAGALCVVEEAVDARLALPPGFVLLDERRVADTRLAIVAAGDGAAAEAGRAEPA